MKFQIRLRLIVSLSFYVLGYVMMTRPLPVVLADPGDLDSTFGVDYNGDSILEGYYLSDGSTASNAYDMFVNSNGNIFIVGGLSSCSNSGPSLSTGYVSQFSSIGSLNTTLGTDGAILFDADTTDISDTTILNAIKESHSGDFFATGYNVPSGSDKNLVVAKFDANGTNDSSYHATANYDSSFGNDFGSDLALDMNDNVIVVGSASNASRKSDMLIVKFDRAGNPVNDFDDDGIKTYSFSVVEDGLNAIALDYNEDESEYSIVAVGYAVNAATDKKDIAIIKLTSTGTFDVSDSASQHIGFDSDGFLSKDFFEGNDEATDVVLDESGNLYVTGYVTSEAGDTNVFVAKYSSSGSPDSTFGTDGYAFIDSGLGNDKGYAIILDSKGSVLVSGRMASEETDSFFVARITSEGILDPTFGEVSGDRKLGYNRLDLSETETHSEYQIFHALQLDANENILALGAIQFLTDAIVEPVGEQTVLARFEGGYISTTICGNSIVDVGETCDDGNTVDGDGCSSVCLAETTAICGDDHLDDGEECDDGNWTPGDMCSAVCTIEADSDHDGYYGEADCDDSNASIHADCVNPSESTHSDGGGCGCVISKQNANPFEVVFYGATILALALMRLRKRV